MTSPLITGLGSGLDLMSVVNQLMQAERAPEMQMNSSRLAALGRQTAWSDIGSKLSSLITAAHALDTVATAQGATATSSLTSVLTATASPGALQGTTLVNVLKLASAQQLSTGGLSSSSMLVGAGQAVVSAGLGTIGGSNLTTDATTTAGGHSIQVYTASQAAQSLGTTGPALSYATGANDLTVTLADGVAHTVTLASSYADANALVSDLNTQLAGVASFSISAGQLQVSSRDEGSAASLTLSGGSLAGLGLTAGTTNGKDAQLSLDGGALQTVTHVDNGTVVSLGGGVSFTTGTHLSTGTATFDVVRTTATSTVADLAAALNAAGSPVSASVVNTNDGTSTPYRLMLTAKATGTAGALTIATSGINVLDPSQLTTVTSAADAQLSVGGSTITRSSNTVTDLIPGVTLNLAGTGTSTVTVSSDPTGTQQKAQALVDAINGVLSSVANETAYNASTKKAQPLNGDSLAEGISQSLVSQVFSAVGTGTTKVLSQLGIQTTRDGTLTLDTAALATAMQNDPSGTASLLSSFASSVEAYAKQTTDPLTGLTTTQKAAAAASASSYQDQIDSWEVRMTALETSYRAKFSKLDAVLGTLKSQQASLAAALSGLSTSTASATDTGSGTLYG